MERANMPAEPGGADRLFRGDFLFGGQQLQDTTCNFTLRMETTGGLATWDNVWGKLTGWGAGNGNASNYAAYWYPTSEKGNANFLVFSRTGSTLWETNTWSSDSFEVVQQIDANVVMYQSGGGVPWASNQMSGPFNDICGSSGFSGTKTWMRPHKNLNGMDYWHDAIPTLGECGRSCATDTNCRSFTYYQGVCWKKSGQPTETVLTNAFSGRKMVGNHTKYE
jgi:hypothetical protein